MLVYFIGTVLGKIITFMLVPIYTHVFDPDDYGASDLAYTTVVMLVSVAFMELWTGLLRFSYDEKGEEGKKRLFRHVLILGLLFMPLYLALTIGIALWQGLPHVGLMAVTGILLLFMHLWQYMVRGLGESRAFVISGAISSFVQLLAVLAGVYLFHAGTEMLLIAPMCGAAGAILYIECRFHLLKSAKAPLDKKLLRALVRFSLPLAVNAVAYNAMTNLARLFAKNRLPSEESGYIALASKFVLIVTSLVYIYLLAWQESAYEEAGEAGRAGYYASMCAIFSDGMAAMTAGFILATDLFFPYFIGEDFLPTAGILPVYYVSTLIYAFSTFFGHVFNAEKKNNVLFWSTAAGAVTNLGLLYLLIDKMGVMAVPLTLALGYVVNLAIRMILLRKIILIPLPLGKMLLCAALSLLAAAAVLLKAGTVVEILLLVGIEGFYLYLDREKLLTLAKSLKSKIK